jgi:hypothetical protein
MGNRVQREATEGERQDLGTDSDLGSDLKKIPFTKNAP